MVFVLCVVLSLFDFVQDDLQKVTDTYIKKLESMLKVKETDLLKF